ncbi:MAG: HIT domain-containing protein [Brevibacterium sp.]|nr:HIT domain-containing protein [Brevibacterium sp.]
MDCVLCEIVSGKEPAELLCDADDWLAIAPLRKISPVHFFLFPRVHFENLHAYLKSAPGNAGGLMQWAADIAESLELHEFGYRLTWNFGPATNQSVLHPHLHLLGGKQLRDELA